MLGVDKLLQDYQGGQLDGALVIPRGWTGQDSERIGCLVLVGRRETGYVGLIHSAKHGIVWFTDEAYENFADAQRDLFEEANRRKADIVSAANSTART